MSTSTNDAAMAAAARRARLIRTASEPLSSISQFNEPTLSGQHAASDFFQTKDRASSVRAIAFCVSVDNERR
jgi:hypothetical protein